MASTTPNFGFKLWNALMDRFNHNELVENWNKVDAHDHTGGVKGLKIPSGGIANGAVDSGQIADGAIETAKLGNASVTETKLGLSSVNTAQVKDGAITKPKLSSDLQGLVTDTTGRGIRMGTGVCTFDSAVSGTVAITHSLGTTPLFVICNPKAGGSLFATITYVGTSAVTSTQFTARFETVQRDLNLINGTVQFQWLVIG